MSRKRFEELVKPEAMVGLGFERSPLTTDSGYVRY